MSSVSDCFGLKISRVRELDLRRKKRDKTEWSKIGSKAQDVTDPVVD